MHRAKRFAAHLDLTSGSVSSPMRQLTGGVNNENQDATRNALEIINKTFKDIPKGSLKGKTLFITGGSRGIGLAIGLVAARDGANVAIVAKTTLPHAALEGTIFTAAEEINRAGGRGLPVECDIRFEDQVKKAVEITVKHFGGIDILINNASAIRLTDTASTAMKDYDLMNQINARGTYMCRMSEEFKDDGIAVNALWPLTSIATAAVKNLLGGEDMVNTSRLPSIMADAAYVILTAPKTVTGAFFIDEQVLKATGVNDFAKYAVVPGTKDSDMTVDFFVDID